MKSDQAEPRSQSAAVFCSARRVAAQRTRVACSTQRYANAELLSWRVSATVRAVLFPASLPRLFAAAFVVLSMQARAAVPAQPGFNRDIRPILSNTCFFCHGPDEKKRDGDRRLDTFEGATADVDGVRAIVPGRPEESELLKRIVSHDRDEVMPPPKSKRPPLTAEQAATLRRWIEQGAKYEGHWAFLPVAKPAPPAVREASWARHPLDRFILARLEAENIQPSPPADLATLCRRLYLDLTGLLPTPEDVDAFLRDASNHRPAAIEKLVDRLLASPHYGERWGRHWLDQARYADSNGYTIDSERAMWPYRDWVIKALNDDMPFDQFTIEQLAGDLLPNSSKSQLIATAFHRNTLINEEGGTDKEQFRIESVVDRVNTTGAVWLGLTVGCAQCHTHKFDPIAHREYFQLFAFFNSDLDVNNTGPTVPVERGEVFGAGPTAEQRAAVAETARMKRQRTWEERQVARLGAPAAASPAWKPAKHLDLRPSGAGAVTALEDGSLLYDRSGAPQQMLRVIVAAGVEKIAAVRVRVLPHESLPQQGPGTSSGGGFVLSDFEITKADGASPRIVAAIADAEEGANRAAHAIDEDPASGWAPGGQPGVPHEIVFQLESPLEIGAEPLDIKLRHDVAQNAVIGRFAIDFIAALPEPALPAGEPFAAALRAAPAERSPEQAKLVRNAFERAAPASKLSGPRSNLADGDSALLMVMKALAQPRPTFLLQRGDFLRPDKAAGPLQPGVIAAVNAAFAQPPAEFRNRLDLARWLVSPENPLTSRVAVNRMWMRYFGRGLVETEEDFGTQGTPPTHPELLDWLAREFVRGGWSMKAMHRLIATSATYAQASAARPDLAEKDPRNLLLARQERVRLEAEIVRDAALAASGLLDRTIGGPSVRPPQAEGVYSFTQTNRKWIADTGTNRFRRALYTLFFRSAPHPLFTTFDAPDFQTVCTRRARSNTPLQALTVANDPAFLEFAQGLAARLRKEVPEENLDARLRRAFVLCLSRAPSAGEFDVLKKYAASQNGDLTAVARVLLNTDNFITRE